MLLVIDKDVSNSIDRGIERTSKNSKKYLSSLLVEGD